MSMKFRSAIVTLAVLGLSACGSNSSTATSATPTSGATGSCTDVSLSNGGKVQQIKVSGGGDCVTATTLAQSASVLAVQSLFDQAGYHCTTPDAPDSSAQNYVCTNGTKRITFISHAFVDSK